ncbi:hypothetical protein COI89_18760, partial [Bacillus cereus]
FWDSPFFVQLSELDDVRIEKYLSKIDIDALQKMTNTLTKINQIMREEKKKLLESEEVIKIVI